MHFTVLYIQRNEKVEDTNLEKVAEYFGSKFCYYCGEYRPTYYHLCDWFQIGGRWCDLLKATKGIKGDRSLLDTKEKSEEDKYSICNIEDLTEDINSNIIYAVVKGKNVYESDNHMYQELLDKVNKKQIKGMVSLIDCHD